MTRSGADLALLLLGGFRALADAGSAELAERGFDKIRPIHDFALHSIVAGAETTAELAHELGISKQAVIKTVGFLEAEGYVTVAADERDGRRRLYSLTERGQELLRTGQEVFDELRDRWAQRIGADQVEALGDALADLGVRAPAHHDAAGWFSGSPAE
ncbi:MarR family winged helix-turn-helix transcriptional regulator [Cellulomonas fengjieae]|uniref:Winged helix DNA-binding protein n=1 Tax=Cellulomonas fengjieae TaxID=2819978 RepID=A0ABS3SG22_9CELL|nr:winged helix DNA-binding protein [Cellulomonas fengjieae]MBO3084700.1 winged helix DNA-binding protein [Cellulomonas fengjieae]MBO3103472.1 winged helix DNA-binding protein [Cellulomonas fengjieae]QVI66977.1 winged helix DNA-binding protein [Cellulomonas fengjieae]